LSVPLRLPHFRGWLTLLLSSPQQYTVCDGQSIVWHWRGWHHVGDELCLGTQPSSAQAWPSVADWGVATCIWSIPFRWTTVRCASPSGVRIADSDRIGATITDRVSSATSWRYVCLFDLVAMGLPIIRVLVGLSTYNRCGDRYRSLRISSSPAWSQIPFAIDFILAIGATVCFELALYYGALRGWHQPRAISLFAAGSGVCLAALLVIQILFIRKPTYLRLLSYSTRWLLVVTVLLSFSWGITYHTFAHYLRK
jgi:hypothetical protein